MPFTPFHMGPGLAVKALAGRHMSLMVFGMSQVAMDIEPLVRIFRGDAVLHGPSHTYIGASVVGLISMLVGRPICQFFLTRWTAHPHSLLAGWSRGPVLISWPAAAAGAFVGTFSHVFLDSIMHADMQPFWPFSPGNPMLLLVSIRSLHLFCVASGFAGGLLMLALFLVRRGPQAD